MKPVNKNVLLQHYGICFRALMFNLASFSLCVFVRRDILRVGVTLAGHQKKILNSVQMMRAQMNQIQSVEVWPRAPIRLGGGQEEAAESQPERMGWQPQTLSLIFLLDHLGYPPAPSSETLSFSICDIWISH